VLERLRAEPYQTIRARHVEEHRALFSRCWLELGRPESENEPTDQRLAALRRVCLTRGCAPCCSITAATSSWQVHGRRASPRTSRAYGTTSAPALELQLDDQHQHRVELLARRDDPSRRMPRAAHGTGERPFARRRHYGKGLLRVRGLGGAPQRGSLAVDMARKRTRTG
jgi:hypothetical protein